MEEQKVPKWDEVTYLDWLAAECLTSLLIKFGNIHPIVTGNNGNPHYDAAAAAYRYAEAFVQLRNRRNLT
jgi:hypothetical protein